MTALERDNAIPQPATLENPISSTGFAIVGYQELPPEIKNLSSAALHRYAIEHNLIINRPEWIDIKDIIDDNTPYDSEHAIDLAKLIYRKRRFTQTVLVRSTQRGEKILYDVLDGFHRVAGLRILPPPEGEEKITHVFAMVLYNCPDEEMYEQRIIAANSVQGDVKALRADSWLNAAWQLTPWGKDKNIHMTAAQAFMLAANDSSGRNSGLTPEQARDIKNWANDKAITWRSTVATLAQKLMQFDKGDQRLRLSLEMVHREKRGVSLTMEQFDQIVNCLPYLFDSQIKLASFIRTNNIGKRTLTNILAEIEQTDKTVDQVVRVLNFGTWKRENVDTRSPSAHRSAPVEKKEPPLPRVPRYTSPHSERGELTRAIARQDTNATLAELRTRLETEQSSPVVVYQAIQHLDAIQQLLNQAPEIRKQTDTFIHTWTQKTPERYEILHNNQKTIERLIESLESFDDPLILNIAAVVLDVAFDPDIDRRLAAHQIVVHFPWYKLTMDHLTFLVDRLQHNLTNLSNNTHAKNIFGTVLEPIAHLCTVRDIGQTNTRILRERITLIVKKLTLTDPGIQQRLAKHLRALQ